MMTIPPFRPRSPLRWTQLFVLSLGFALALPRGAYGQWRDAVAVSPPRSVASPSRTPVAFDVSSNEGTWQAGAFWRWTAIGLLVGAVAADGWVALEMARNHSDDGMIPPIIPLAIVGAAGGVGGGLIGAIAYTASHPGGGQTPQ